MNKYDQTRLKEIEKKLMEPSKIPLEDIRQLKRELVILRKEKQSHERKKTNNIR